MRLQRRIERLERLRPPPPPPEDDQRLRRKRRVLKRWKRLARAALPLLPDDLGEGLPEAIRRLKENNGGPIGIWLRHLFRGWCRLPELAPAVMKDLLLAWVSPDADGSVVCNACGLEYPQHRRPPLHEWKLLPGRRPNEGTPPWFDLPEFFRSCPHCGASSIEMDWPHLVLQNDHPWKQLDGYVG